MIPLSSAQAFVLERIPLPVATEVPIPEAIGLTLATDMVATEAIPPFDNTAVDGYALRAEDVATVPATLRIIGEVRAGQGALASVGSGEAVRIMTGAPIPPGADAVVMVEDTTTSDDAVTVRAETPTGDNIRRRGESVAPGSVVLTAGTRLRAPHLGVLAELGRTKVPVYRRLRVGVIATGDELVTDGRPLGPGQIRESNAEMLVALIAGANCLPVSYGVVRDEEHALTAAIERGVRECDTLVTSGGVSMGEYDLVKQILDKLGTMEWMQIAIRPAKPFAFGIISTTDRSVPVFGLPGNPVSSFVSFEVLARPALRRMMGDTSPDRPVVLSVADTAIRRRMGDGKQHLVRVAGSFGDDGRFHVTPTGAQGSHQLAHSSAANGIAFVADGEAVEPGDEVRVLFLD